VLTRLKNIFMTLIKKRKKNKTLGTVMVLYLEKINTIAILTVFTSVL